MPENWSSFTEYQTLLRSICAFCSLFLTLLIHYQGEETPDRQTPSPENLDQNIPDVASLHSRENTDSESENEEYDEGTLLHPRRRQK